MLFAAFVGGLEVIAGMTFTNILIGVVRVDIASIAL